jgi:energy-coupling factor transporter transmembrane protein EcfT
MMLIFIFLLVCVCVCVRVYLCIYIILYYIILYYTRTILYYVILYYIIFPHVCFLVPFLLILFFIYKQVHYMINAGFLRRGQLIDNVDKIKHMKVAICHGRGDYVCQPQAAWRLAQRLRKLGCSYVELEFVSGAGHSDSEPGLVDAMVRASDKLADALLSEEEQ